MHSEANESPTCKRDYDAAGEEPAKIARKEGNTVDINAPVEDKLQQLPPLPSSHPSPHHTEVLAELNNSRRSMDSRVVH